MKPHQATGTGSETRCHRLRIAFGGWVPPRVNSTFEDIEARLLAYLYHDLTTASQLPQGNTDNDPASSVPAWPSV